MVSTYCVRDRLCPVRTEVVASIVHPPHPPPQGTFSPKAAGPLTADGGGVGDWVRVWRHQTPVLWGLRKRRPDKMAGDQEAPGVTGPEAAGDGGGSVPERRKGAPQVQGPGWGRLGGRLISEV